MERVHGVRDLGVAHPPAVDDPDGAHGEGRTELEAGLRHGLHLGGAPEPGFPDCLRPNAPGPRARPAGSSTAASPRGHGDGEGTVPPFAACAPRSAPAPGDEGGGMTVHWCVPQRLIRRALALLALAGVALALAWVVPQSGIRSRAGRTG